MNKEEFRKYVERICGGVLKYCNEYLSDIGLSIGINWGYDFSGSYSDCIGVYELGSVFEGEIVIGCNLEGLYKYIRQELKVYPTGNAFTLIKEAISTNIYHEMGHGLLELINDYLEYSDELDELYDANQELFNGVLDNEEESVEEFAWCLYDGNDDCGLCRIMSLYRDFLDSSKKKNSNTMKIKESDLRAMICESISKVLLREYGGEQLVLPFDGDTGAYNYEQYIDFVKSVTKPGELVSNIHSIDDYYRKMDISDEFLFEVGMNAKFYNGYAREEFSEDEYDFVIGELEDKYGKEIYGKNNNPLSVKYNIGEELSEKGFRYLVEYLIDYGKQDLKLMLGELFRYSNNGMVYINRVLIIPKALSRYKEEDVDEYNYNGLYDLLVNEYNNLGNYWAYGVDTGGAYWYSNFKGGNSHVRLIGMTPIENVDIPETSGVNSVGENEIFLHDDKKIMLIGIEIDGKKINIGHRVCK